MTEPSSNRRTGLAVALVLGLAGLGFALWWSLEPPPAEPPPELRPAQKPPASADMTEAERRAYLAQFVRVEEFEVGPDQPSPDEPPVPGLLAVTGEVVNLGERRIERVFLAVHPVDEAGEVLAELLEDVARGLPAGARRRFRFTIPEDSSSAGFEYEIR